MDVFILVGFKSGQEKKNLPSIFGPSRFYHIIYYHIFDNNLFRLGYVLYIPLLKLGALGSSSPLHAGVKFTIAQPPQGLGLHYTQISAKFTEKYKKKLRSKGFLGDRIRSGETD